MSTSRAFVHPEPMQGHPGHAPAPHLQIERLSVGYGARWVLRDVSFDIEAGGITALMGPSGCGKSSLLLALNRITDLIRQARVRGRVVFDGQDILQPGIDLQRLRQRMGMVFQRPNPFPLSVWRNLELPLRAKGISRRDELSHRIENGLQQVGLWSEVRDRLHAPALNLSGGQQQRLCVARALVLEPEVLLMDEPCSSLDPLSSAVVEELILSPRGRYTVLIVTHHLAQAKRMAEQAAFFWTKDGVGRLIEFGPTQQMFSSPKDALTAAYVSGRQG
jgi:phosphate transport system ATP-binding protein